jgi:hypothetical protein
MAHRSTLTEAQTDVLRWVSDGCPEGVYEDVVHRISAAALKRRGLVTVTGRGPMWVARITDEGRRYLEKLSSESPPVPRQANVSVTQQLVDDVIAAGGTARFPRPTWRQPSVDYARRAELAHRFGKVPDGKQLVVASDGDQVEISLVDAPRPPGPSPAVLVVPDRVGHFHPTVRAFRSEASRHEVTRAQLPRVCRILHVLLTEAERRGYRTGLTVSPEGPYRYRWSGPNDGHLAIDTDDYQARLRIIEGGLGSRAYFDRQNGTYGRGDDGTYVKREWTISDYEAKANGRLCLELLGWNGGSHRQHRWSDQRRRRLEEMLGDVLAEIEFRGVEAREAHERARREAEDKQRRWEAAMSTARQRVVEQRLADALRSQVGAWEDAARIRAWCDAAEAGHGSDPLTVEWVTWARRYADDIDSLRRPPRRPDPGEISAEDLRPFLDGWNPYGVNRR